MKLAFKLYSRFLNQVALAVVQLKAGWGLLKNATISTERVLVAKKSLKHDFARACSTNYNMSPSTSIELRKFCSSSPVGCFRRRGMATSTLTRSEEDEVLFSDLYRSPLPPPKARKNTHLNSLNAAEREWLQHDEQIASSNEIQSAVRYDWRKRTMSRMRPSPPTKYESQDETTRRTRHPRRMLPPQMDVQWGEPFYHAIQAYKKR